MSRLDKTQRLKALATYRILAARARAVLGSSKLTNATINALAKTSAMAALSKANRISASVKASLLVASAKTGKFFTLLALDDTATASEIRNFNMSKLAVNEIQAVDRAIAELRKVLADAAHVADQVNRVVGKGIEITSTTYDTLTRESTKPLVNSAVMADAAAKGVSTNKADVFTTGDTANVTAGKGLVDTPITADLLSRTVAFIRVFTDTADATDEINANLLTDDGEVIYLEKVLLDDVITSETRTVSMARVQTDSFSTNDAALLAAAKRLDDLIGVGDFDVVEFGMSRSDFALAYDSATFGVGKYVSDSFVTADLLTNDFQKTLSDTVHTSDSLRFFLDAYFSSSVATSEDVNVVRIAAGGVPPQVDNQFASDTTSVGVNKVFADVLGATDDFLGEATIDDDQVTLVGKNLTENLPTSELRTVTLQRTLQESATAADSGLLAMTDYCDSTYFSQAYVGTERIFS